MNQVVRDAGMLRLALDDRLQDGRAFELVGVGLVGRRGRRVERERVVDLRLVVVRIALRQLFHGLGISLHARAVIDLVVVGVHGAERVDVVALALRFRADRLRLGDCGSAFGEILRRRRRRGDSTAGSARCPNRRCRIRDRPSAHPRILAARRGTRTNAVPAFVLVPRLAKSIRGCAEGRSRMRHRLLGHRAQPAMESPRPAACEESRRGRCRDGESEERRRQDPARARLPRCARRHVCRLRQGRSPHAHASLRQGHGTTGAALSER